MAMPHITRYIARFRYIIAAALLAFGVGASAYVLLQSRKIAAPAADFQAYTPAAALPGDLRITAMTFRQYQGEVSGSGKVLELALNHQRAVIQEQKAVAGELIEAYHSCREIQHELCQVAATAGGQQYLVRTTYFGDGSQLGDQSLFWEKKGTWVWVGLDPARAEDYYPRANWGPVIDSFRPMSLDHVPAKTQRLGG